MLKNIDGSIILEKREKQSLVKMIAHVHSAISQLPSDVDIVGYENWLAMSMWEDVLQGNVYDIASYIDDDDESDEDSEEKIQAQTVEEWLEAYGKTDS